MKPAVRTRIDRLAVTERARADPTIPVPVEEILRSAGVALSHNHHDSYVAGMALRQGSMRIVGVNTRTSPRRTRFAAAHAYGHLLLHPHRDLTVCHQIAVDLEPAAADATPVEEVEATWFAGALLMPAGALRAELGREYTTVEHLSRDALIEALARLFAVSPEAMGWRLVSLGFTSA